MKDQVGFSFLEDLIQRPMHRQPAQLSAARELTQILSDFAGINVDRANNAEPRFARGEAQGFQADGTKPVLDHIDSLHEDGR